MRGNSFELSEREWNEETSSQNRKMMIPAGIDPSVAISNLDSLGSFEVACGIFPDHKMNLPSVSGY